MKALFGALVLALCAGVVVIAQVKAQRPDSSSGSGKHQGPRFDAAGFIKDYDKNGDGKLSKDELPERMQVLMDRADANKDGFLDRSELMRYAQQQSMRGPGGPGGGPGRGFIPRGGGPGPDGDRGPDRDDRPGR